MFTRLPIGLSLLFFGCPAAPSPPVPLQNEKVVVSSPARDAAAVVELEARIDAAWERGAAAKERGDFEEMERAADSMLSEAPDDSALLCLKAEALELRGDLYGALSAVQRAMKASAPPPGVKSPEEPDPYARMIQYRIMKKLRRMAWDAGR